MLQYSKNPNGDWNLEGHKDNIAVMNSKNPNGDWNSKKAGKRLKDIDSKNPNGDWNLEGHKDNIAVMKIRRTPMGIETLW